MTFEDYFSENSILEFLAQRRIRLAHKRHEREFYWRISTGAPSPRMPDQLDKIFPPRSQWPRPNRSRRNGRTSQTIQVRSLLWSVTRAKKAEGNHLPWSENLSALVSSIQSSALDGIASIASPRIAPVRKPGKMEFRPVSVFDSLRDVTIICLTNKYLRDLFDPDFLDCSFAFRSPRGTQSAPTHHDAVRALIEARQASLGDLYVAECDIASFFDTVHHDVAWSCFQKACRRAEERGQAIDRRSVTTFDAYLSCYSFFGTAEPQAEMYFKSHGLVEARLKDPAIPLARFYEDPRQQPIGVPQGGALSCLIANLLLHDADMAVTDALRMPGVESRYLRYCDDMIIVSPLRRNTDAGMRAYQNALNVLRLPYHEFKVCAYGREWWSMKSRSTYRWCSQRYAGDIPWIGFLGYQIRYDGLMRVRPDSLKKEIAKQKRIINLVRKSIKNTSFVRKSHKQIIFRAHQKLISMAVGRHTLISHQSPFRSPCWIAGFKQLSGQRVLLSQFRQLDRSRNRALGSLKYALSRQPPQPSDARRVPRARRYFGHPYSYHYPFCTKTNAKPQTGA